MVNWEIVCLSKADEGLGIINLKSFNKSLLAKWIWKAITNNSIAGETLKSLYAKANSFIQDYTPSLSLLVLEQCSYSY